MATPQQESGKKLTFKKFEEGDHEWDSWADQIFNEDHSHKCPVYVHRTPPCQGNCPSGHEIRGWLQIARDIEKPPQDMEKYDYAFYRNTDSNPFPAIMGRVCPAPCQEGCNRNSVDDFVGINSVEQFIGDRALASGLGFDNKSQLSGKKVAIVGGGPAGLAAAYQLRRMGHASTIFEARPELGGMMRYGIPNYRIPRKILQGEIDRILAMGDIEIRTNTKIGEQVNIEQLENDYDAVLWAFGCWTGRPLPAANAENVPNVVNAVEYLEAFNRGRLKVTSSKVVCVGGGDTSIDVVTVARRLGYVEGLDASQRPEAVIQGDIDHSDDIAANRQANQVTLTAVFPRDSMTATEAEIEDAHSEGVNIMNEVMPLEVLLDDSGRARGMKMAKCTTDAKGIPSPIEGTEFEIEADLIVSAIGQGTEIAGLESMTNDYGFIDASANFTVANKPGHFAAGDIIRPHLLTTAIGQARIAVESIDAYISGQELGRRPKIDVNHFDMMEKLKEVGREPEAYVHGPHENTDTKQFAIHNYEDRASKEIIEANELFLGHFEYSERNRRKHLGPKGDEVLGHYVERSESLSEEEATAEADRCMSCGMCFECDNCVIFCPQDAVFRVKKDAASTGRYVETDYSRCVGCHICSDVCPTGYIDMAMGG